MKKLSVHLVAWNGAEYIPHVFESLRKQTYTDWELHVLDNGSTDKTLEYIKKELGNFTIQNRLVELRDNIGFAGGHNKLLRDTNSEYVLLLNQDMYIAPDCFEKMVDFLEKNENVASLSPRLMRWDFDNLSDKVEDSFSNKIDALGLKVMRTRRVVEQYTAENWNEIKIQFDTNVLEVFGVSGALPFFRKEVLDVVSFENGNLFDETYGSYKEDVDLAYRLRSSGYDSVVLLDAVAYHDRSGAGPRLMDDMSAIKNKMKQSPWVTYNSYKNHLSTIYKNEYILNFILDFPWILWYELKKFVYFLLFNRRALEGLYEVLRARKTLKNKRMQIVNKRRVGWKEIRRWWSL